MLVLKTVSSQGHPHSDVCAGCGTMPGSRAVERLHQLHDSSPTCAVGWLGHVKAYAVVDYVEEECRVLNAVPHFNLAKSIVGKRVFEAIGD